jgi:hypothetical protein
VAKLPAVNVVSFRSRTQGDMFFLTDAHFQLGESGKISASGEFGDNSRLHVEWSQVDVDPFLQEPWRSRLSGVLAGTSSIEWPESGIAAGRAVGNFRLTDGVAENIEMLEQVATFTGAPQFRRMPLQELSGTYEWTRSLLKITNLVAESKGLMRLEGSCNITENENLSGLLRVGVTPQTLQWLPACGSASSRSLRMAICGRTLDRRITAESAGGPFPRLAAAVRDEAIQQGRRLIEQCPMPPRMAPKVFSIQLPC